MKNDRTPWELTLDPTFLYLLGEFYKVRTFNSIYKGTNVFSEKTRRCPN